MKQTKAKGGSKNFNLENWKDGMPSSKTGKLRSSRFGEKDQVLKFGYAECEMPLRRSKEDLK